jgi:hypothetical protein
MQRRKLPTDAKPRDCAASIHLAFDREPKEQNEQPGCSPMVTQQGYELAG